MSAILRAHKAVARGHYRGDPGIFGSIWSGIKGAATGFVTGGVGGAIMGGVAGLASNGKPKNPSLGAGGGPLGTLLQKRQLSTLPMTAPVPADVNIFSPNSGNQILLAPPLYAGPGRGNTTQGGFGGIERDPNTPGSGATPCARGYHYNKSGYFTQRYGWIPRGTVCVKNRKRNPLNPRAASRAMARLSSAKKAASFLSKVSIRSSGCGCK